MNLILNFQPSVSTHLLFYWWPQVNSGNLWRSPLFIHSPPQLPHLGFALKVEGEHIFPRPGLALTNHKETVTPGPACKHQLSCTYTGQCTMEPRVTYQAGITVWLFCSVSTTWVKRVFFFLCVILVILQYWVSTEEMKCLCYLQKKWSSGPLGTGGSALKACEMGAEWKGVPCNGLKGCCNALLLSDMTFLKHDTHLHIQYFLYFNKVFLKYLGATWQCSSLSSLTLRQQLTAARGHHGAVFGGLTVRTWRQLDVIATVTVHKQGGGSGKNVYTCARPNK